MIAERPIRLLMTTDAVGGVWQYSLELAASLTAHQVETTLAVIGPGLDEDRRNAARKVPGLSLIETDLPLDWLSDTEGTARAADGVAALTASTGADILHLNSPALAAEQRFPVPVLGVAHGCVSTWWEAARPGEPLDLDLAWHRELMARGLRACDRVIAPSASYAETLRLHYRLPVGPGVVHNGRSGPLAENCVPLQDCAFTAGRLWDEVKNTRTLDAVAARLPFPFHAAGDVLAPHGESAVTEHLHLLGHLDSAALDRWLSHRPVFVSAATFEPFGLAVLEAASHGCALVLSDIPVFRELWEGAAIFAAPEDPVGLAAAIQDCAEDLPFRRRLGEAARTRAARYSAERMSKLVAAEYRALLEARIAA